MAVIDEALERLPGFTQRDAVVVDHLTVCVPRVLLVTGLKGEGRVDQIAIGIVDLASAQARLEGFTQRIANRLFVPIAFCAVETAYAALVSTSADSERKTS
jgi:hypothetical protein